MIEYEQIDATEKEAFRAIMAAATDLELFDLYCMAAESDDLDGDFSEMQGWKRERSRETLSQRLATRK